MNKQKNIGMSIQEEKLKTLMPTLRVKKRFIRIKIDSSKKLSFEDIAKVLNEQVLYFMGALDFSQSGFWILKDQFDFDKQELIVKTTVTLKDKVILSLSLIENFTIDVKRVSGTLKGVRKDEYNKK